MKKNIYVILFLSLFIIFFNSCKEPVNKKFKIGIILPIVGYEEVLDGFKEAVNNSKYKDKIELIIKNYSSNKEEYEAVIKTLHGQNIDLFYTVTTPVTLSTYEMLKDKPIVFTAVEDPIGAGLADNFRAPKKGITGVTDLSRELTLKRLEYFKIAFPKIKQILVIYNKENVCSVLSVKDIENISEKLNITIEKEEVSSKDEIIENLKRRTIKKIDGIFIVSDPIIYTAIDEITNFAKENKIPTCVSDKRWVIDKGATIGYGTDLKELGKLSFVMVEHILMGGNPEDFPVFVPEKMVFIINNNWAKKNGYMIPQEILYLADVVI